MHRLRYTAAPEAGRLLRDLLLRLAAVSADSGAACGRAGGGLLLHRISCNACRYGTSLSRSAGSCAHQSAGFTLQHPLTRTSEAKAHWRVYDPGAAFRFEVS